MKKSHAASLCVFLCALLLTACDIPFFHSHSYKYVCNKDTHQKIFICGCPSSNIAEKHYDNDDNQECDACSYFIGTKVSGLAMGTYYLPHTFASEPVSITFFENGRCVCKFSDADKADYHCNYRIEDGTVWLDIETALKYHVFKITDNALIFDTELSSASLWDSAAHRGPVIYCLPGISQSEILATAVMAKEKLEALPEIDKIYGKYEYRYSNGTHTYDVYAFMVGGPIAGDCWSDKILGTDYTFTYEDSREILIYTQGRLITLNEAFDRGYITTEILGELNETHHNCEIAHSYDEGAIAQIPGGGEEILYTCNICHATKSAPLPADFSFTVTWGFDGYYDSKTGELKNGYNYTLDTACETTLRLNHDELMNIYRILYNAGFLEITEDFRASDQQTDPSYNIKISYTIGEETVAFTIRNASFLSYTEWKVHSAFCHAYNQVIVDFIQSSDEFKALPPNQKMYY